MQQGPRETSRGSRSISAATIQPRPSCDADAESRSLPVEIAKAEPPSTYLADMSCAVNLSFTLRAKDLSPAPLPPGGARCSGEPLPHIESGARAQRLRLREILRQHSDVVVFDSDINTDELGAASCYEVEFLIG